MKIAIIEPFYGGSHKQWCDEYRSHSQHEIHLFTLSAHHWKWRMHGAAVTLAEQFTSSKHAFDLIIASDFLNLPLFKSLIGAATNIPTVVYFHENQITYPWSPDDVDVQLNRDNTYGFINYTSALIADHIYFNSEYHQKSFLEALPNFLNQFPDHPNLDSVELIKKKSSVLYLGIDYSIFDKTEINKCTLVDLPVILWNHRWEYDKNPEEFFEVLFQLKARKITFQLIVLGQKMKRSPKIFTEARERLNEEIMHWGFCESKTDYARMLHRADILPVTSNQDFFGISIVEAVYCRTYPLLPRRLSYGEHIHAPEHFYISADELYEKLSACCLNITHTREFDIPKQILRYNWTRMAQVYDNTFFQAI